jgi:asparagine synthase (glutamine-hydrolysing)
MCGICGKLAFGGAEVQGSVITSMLGTIRHRGPDDEGMYLAPGIGLGHRRLSIIDLSAGHQPLSNEDGTVWIVFNGEIYNYQDLRSTLQAQGHVFKTKSDTEVIVHLYEQYGVACVEKLSGMFAFAIWDNRAKVLFIARDRVGIKPLYYCQTKTCLIFGSEIKAILADSAVTPTVDLRIIDRFLSFYFIPGDDTLFEGIKKLPPGHYLIVKDNVVTIRQYWDLQFHETPISMREAESRTLELLDAAVGRHMISDVPVGFLLSGGVDSTAMLDFAIGKTTFPLRSYTLGFSEAVEADERPYARLAANRYGSEHHEMSMTSQDFVDFLPKYTWHMEEPVCEPQAIALYYVSKMASSHVKVLISGEGGDEAFGGYSIYRNIVWLERAKKLLSPLNGTLGASVKRANRILHSPKLSKYGPLLDVPFGSYYYSRTSSPAGIFNRNPLTVYSKDFLGHVDKQSSVSVVLAYLNSAAGGRNIVNRMLYVDTKTSLPDDLLLKADKMTMANSLELRVPFLDHEVLEFAASLPANYKVRRFRTKHIAKRALRGRIPSEILQRRKVGFPVPYTSWMRTDLSGWVREVLLDRSTLSRGYFEKRAVEALVAEHMQSGRFAKELFSLITLELWHRTFVAR